MKLISLELQNFRQHAATRVDFNTGIIAITGTNGSGKSTLLEGISWILYGVEAARGNKDSIKWNKAPAKAKVKGELTFKLDDQTYRVVRELIKAEIYLEDGETPIAISHDEVNKYISNLFGMNRSEFFNTYFTGQKELNFLGHLKPIERKKFISKVLNYEKIRTAQEAVRIDKNNIQREIEGIKLTIGDIDVLLAEKQSLASQLETKKAEVEFVQSAFNDTSVRLTKIEPQWESLKAVRDEYQKLTNQLQFLTQKQEYTMNRLIEVENQLESLNKKQNRLKLIESVETQYCKLQREIQELELLQKADYERKQLLVQIESLEREIQTIEAELSQIVESGKKKAAQVKAVPEIEAQINELISKINESNKVHHSEMATLTASAKQKEIEISKLNSQMKAITEKGKDGECPTCRRSLQDEYDSVVDGFKKSISALYTELASTQSQIEELGTEPNEVLDLNNQLTSKRVEFNECKKAEILYEDEKKRYLKSKADLNEKSNKITEIKETLSTIAQGYDENRLNEVKTEFADTQLIYHEYISLRSELAGLTKLQDEKNTLAESVAPVSNELEKCKQAIEKLNYTGEKYDELEAAFNAVKNEFYTTQNQLVRVQAEYNSIHADIGRIEQQEKEHEERKNIFAKKQHEYLTLCELDRFYGIFLDKMNEMARPELAYYAGKLLSDLTDGRYSTLELNDKYEIALFEDGEKKTVISGGEEDIVNLCLRLAISQMIVQRSGRSMSLLILDEIFGSLDESRRQNVVTLLQALTNSFEQVIIITHIDDIKESVDYLIRVEYNEQLGCSVINGNADFASV